MRGSSRVASSSDSVKMGSSPLVPDILRHSRPPAEELLVFMILVLARFDDFLKRLAVDCLRVRPGEARSGAPALGSVERNELWRSWQDA